MRAFLHKYFSYKHKYPIKAWNSAVINGIPYCVTFDGVDLRLIDLEAKHVCKTIEYRQTNAFSHILYANTNITGCEDVFLVVSNHSIIKLYNPRLQQIPGSQIDTHMVVLALKWNKENSRVYLGCANGWIKCLELSGHMTLSELSINWNPVFEQRSKMEWISAIEYDQFRKNIYAVAENDVLVFDIETGEYKFKIKDMHEKGICEIRVDRQSSVITTSGYDGSIKIWNLKFSRAILLSSIKVAPEGWVAFDRKRRFLITMGMDKVFRQFGIGDGIEKCQLKVCPVKVNLQDVGKVGVFALEGLRSTEGCLCVTVHQNEVYVAEHGYAPQEVFGLESPVQAMCYSRTYNSLVCLREDNMVIIGYGTNAKSIDLNIPSVNICQRSRISPGLCLTCTEGKVHVGMKNGALKSFSLTEGTCFMSEELELDESILFLETVEGLFTGIHRTCHGLNTVNHEFIVGYTKNGVFSAWCPRCLIQVMEKRLEKKNIMDTIILPSQSLMMISSGMRIYAFRIAKGNVEDAGEILIANDEIVVAFRVTSSLILVAGTDQGHIVLVQMEEEEDHHMSFTRLSQFGARQLIFRMFYYDEVNVIIAFQDGSAQSINPKTGAISSSRKITDQEKLSVAYCVPRGEDIGLYLAFGTKIHYLPVDIHGDVLREIDKQEQMEEEENEQEITDVVEGVNSNDAQKPDPEVIEEHKETLVVKPEPEHELLDESRADSLTKLRTDLAISTLARKKQNVYIHSNHISMEKDKDSSTSLPKRSFSEVLAMNAREIQKEKDLNDSPRKRKVHRRSTKRETRIEEEIDEDMDLMITPFFYTDLSEHTRYMVPRALKLKKQEEVVPPPRVGLSSRTVVYDEKGNFAIGQLDQKEIDKARTQTGATSRTGRYVVSKTQVSKVKAPTVLKEFFERPPSAPRVLFDDRTTKNALPFFDPRGYENTAIHQGGSARMTQTRSVTCRSVKTNAGYGPQSATTQRKTANVPETIYQKQEREPLPTQYGIRAARPKSAIQVAAKTSEQGERQKQIRETSVATAQSSLQKRSPPILIRYVQNESLEQVLPEKDVILEDPAVHNLTSHDLTMLPAKSSGIPYSSSNNSESPRTSGRIEKQVEMEVEADIEEETEADQKTEHEKDIKNEEETAMGSETRPPTLDSVRKPEPVDMDILNQKEHDQNLTSTPSPSSLPVVGKAVVTDQPPPVSIHLDNNRENLRTADMPLLPNLERYWNEPMIFPVLPFSCGNPNTASKYSFQFTESDLDRVFPDVEPSLFTGPQQIERFISLQSTDTRTNAIY